MEKLSRYADFHFNSKSICEKLYLLSGIFTPKQNGTYSILLAVRSQSSSRAILELFVEKPNNSLHFACKANTFSEHQDSTCSTLYELQVGDKVYPKGSNENGKMQMHGKFGSFQAYFVY